MNINPLLNDHQRPQAEGESPVKRARLGTFDVQVAPLKLNNKNYRPDLQLSSSNTSFNWQETAEKIERLPLLHLTLLCRIGSPSECATVWKMKYQDSFYAVKISKAGFPLEGEYKFAKALSDKYEDLFLRTLCLKKGRVDDGQEYDADLMVMEMAVGDLHQVIEGGVAEEELECYISKVFEALTVMAHEGIKHNDLHIRNVFITQSCHAKNAVLGDFGKSQKAQYLTSVLDDVSMFFRGLKQEMSEQSNMVMPTSTTHKLYQSYINKITAFLQSDYKKLYYNNEGYDWEKNKAREFVLTLKTAWERTKVSSYSETTF